MCETVSTQSTTQVQDVFGCQGDNGSCISKEDEVMISGDHFGGADRMNVTSSVASVSSSCPDVLEKCLIGETNTNGYRVDHMSVAEGDHNSARAHSSEAGVLAKGFSDGLSSNSRIPSVQKPHLQNQHVVRGDESEELVDVRVCDICGDIGRETLLALCSKCSDGAEHIYCMTPKMDKVPENDWLCEECLLVQEPKRHKKAMVESLDNASKSSCSKELSRGSPSIHTAEKHVGKTRNILLRKSSGLSDKTLGTSVCMKTKKRTIDQRVQPAKISGSGRQTRLVQVSLKNMEKMKGFAHQVSSFADVPAKKMVKQAGLSRRRSPNPEQQLCGGSLNSQEIRCSHEDIHQRRSSSKENAAYELKKKHPHKKVLKSLPCTVVVRSPLDVSNAHSLAPTRKSVKCGSGKKYSQENKTIQLRQTRVVSKIVKGANSSRKNVEDKNAIQINGSTDVTPLGSLANEGKNCMNTLGAGSIGERKFPRHSSYVVDSPVVNCDVYSDQRVNLCAQKANFDNNDNSLALYKNLPFDFRDSKVMPKAVLNPADIDHTVPSSISAVPESRCIWKGTFKLDKSEKLSSDCYGVQAHLSTHASSKVDELVSKFSTELQLKVVPRVHAWPIQFQNNLPTEQDIALYFFAQDFLCYQRSYRELLECMTGNDLALEANFGGFQLLVFPSSLLPVKSQCWNSLPFIWGVFRVRKLEGSYFPNLNVSPLNQRSGSSVTYGSESKFVSPLVTRSAFASPTSYKSMEGTDSVDPVVLQSSASMKSMDQSVDHQVPSLEEHTLKKHNLHAGTIIFSDDWRIEGFDTGLLNDYQKGRIFSEEEVRSVSNADIFKCGQSTTPVGLCSDVASGSSLSLDSGPSGLSDSGWCAKSADEDPFQNPGIYNNALNLNLCLGNRSGSNEDVDLDLALGFPTRNADHQPKEYLENGSNRDGNVSLVLSLGMPCSNW